MLRSARWVTGLFVLALMLVASVARAQVTGLYYVEEMKDDRVYVFNTPERHAAWTSRATRSGVAVSAAGRSR